MQLIWRAITPADPADRAALASLYQPVQQSENQDKDEQAGLFGLLDGPGICGVLGWLEDRAVFFVLARQAGPVCDIIELATDSRFRRRGIGLAGLRFFCRHMASQHPQAEMFLEVAEDNLAARRLYQKAGFVQKARRPGYYQRGNRREDALLLCWQADGQSG